MIIIKNTPNKIVISGHTAPIYCSAVSTAAYTTIAALEKYDINSIKMDDNDQVMTITLLKKDNVTKLIFDNLVDVLYTLSVQYPENIKITRN